MADIPALAIGQELTTLRGRVRIVAKGAKFRGRTEWYARILAIPPGSKEDADPLEVGDAFDVRGARVFITQGVAPVRPTAETLAQAVVQQPDAAAPGAIVQTPYGPLRLVAALPDDDIDGEPDPENQEKDRPSLGGAGPGIQDTEVDDDIRGIVPAETLRAELEAAARYQDASLAPATRRAYESDWKAFRAWCADRNTPALPADQADVAVFLASEAAKGLALSTIERRLAAIRLVHEANDTPLPRARKGSVLQRTLGGIAREKGRKTAKKQALTPDLARRMADAAMRLAGTEALGLRNRALILLGFAGAFRRAELAGLEVEDIVYIPGEPATSAGSREDVRASGADPAPPALQGVRITLRRSKTDQEGHGRQVGVPVASGASAGPSGPPAPPSASCPVAALKAWLSASGIVEGPVFRGFSGRGGLSDRAISGETVAGVVKAAAAACGLDPDRIGGHSLRRGWLTAAARAGGDLAALQRQSGHKRLETLMGYIEEARDLDDHPGRSLL